MTTKTINLTLSVNINNAEDYDPKLVTQVIQELAQYGLDHDIILNDSVKEEILDDIIHFSIEETPAPTATEEALMYLLESVNNHTASYGDTNWRNQACAQLERAEMEGCEALGLDWFKHEFPNNTRKNKVG